jgi:hypothetical protein
MTCLLECEQGIGRSHGEICLSPFLRHSADSNSETSTSSYAFIKRDDGPSNERAVHQIFRRNLLLQTEPSRNDGGVDGTNHSGEIKVHESANS